MSYHVFQENPMTAPDSRDSVERIVEELRAYEGDPFGTAKHVFRSWADRLQALARGPQQAGGEDWPKVMGEYLAIMTRCDDAIRETGKATLSRADMEAIERYNLADEHLSMMQADRVASAEAEVARSRELLSGSRNVLNLLRSVVSAEGVRTFTHVESRSGSLVYVHSTIEAIDAALNGGQDDG